MFTSYLLALLFQLEFVLEELDLLVDGARDGHIIAFFVVQGNLLHLYIEDLEVLVVFVEGLCRPIVAIDCILVIVEFNGQIGALKPFLRVCSRLTGRQQCKLEALL